MKPKRFFGLHMVDGTAEYEEDGKAPYKIFVNEQTIRKMGPSFEGCPVYVQHVDEVDLAEIKEADGFVVRSFYNAADGKHWVEFLVITDEGHQAISRGWRLSNAYHPVLKNIPGVWNGMDYQAEVVDGEFEHLAIVDNPRYAESKIFTPEQFREYNDALANDLARVTNSKGEKKTMLNIFKRQKVEKIENSQEIDKLIIELPKSKKEMSIGDLVTNMDASMMPDHMANGEHKVKVGEETMTVNELVDRHMKMCANKIGDGETGEDAKDEGAEHEGDETALNDAGDTDGEGDDQDAKREKAKEDKKKNADDAAAKAKIEADKKKANFDSLKNAHKVDAEPETFIDMSQDKVQRGVSRYGSN